MNTTHQEFDGVNPDLSRHVRVAMADGGQCEDSAELPEDEPCADCYINGGKEWPDE